MTRVATSKHHAQKLANQARHYLANATRLASEPHGTEKAGEMVWGALICALKAVGAAHGKKISRYGAALHFAREIVTPSELMVVGAVKGLHGQFYESEVDAGLLADTKANAEILIDRLLTTEDL